MYKQKGSESFVLPVVYQEEYLRVSNALLLFHQTFFELIMIIIMIYNKKL